MTSLENVVSLIETLKSDISAKLGTEPEKLQRLQDKISELYKYIDSLQKLDFDLISTLKNDASTRQDDTFDKEWFVTNMDKIPEGTITLYVEKAELFRSYASTEADILINHLNTYLRRSGVIYEVVRDNYHQKLYFFIKESKTELQANIETIKEHVLAVAHSFYPNAVTGDEILTFDYNDKTKFLAVGIVLDSYQKRHEFLEELERRLNANGENEIAGKLQIYEPTDLRGARRIPINRTTDAADDTRYFINQLPIVLNVTGNVNIHGNVSINNVVNNNVNVVDNSVNINTINSGVLSVEDFFRHIIDDRPSWYKEGATVNFDVIKKAYREFFNNDEINESVISRRLNKKIFNTMPRSNGQNMKKLYKISEIKRINGLL